MSNRRFYYGIRGIMVFFYLCSVANAQQNGTCGASSFTFPEGHHLFTSLVNNACSYFHEISSLPPGVDFENQYLLWSHVPRAVPDSQGLGNVLATLYDLFTKNGALALADFPTTSLASYLTSDGCNNIFTCSYAAFASYGSQPLDFAFQVCWAAHGHNPSDLKENTWQCTFVLNKIEENTLSGSDFLGACSSSTFVLSRANWIGRGVDYDLQRSLHGGADSAGFIFEAQRAGETFSQTLGRQLLNNPNYQCSLKQPCLPTLDCTQIGSWTAISLGHPNLVLPLPWAFLAMGAFRNINQQLLNQYNELKDAIESLALDTFSIDDFLPHNGLNPDLLKGLAGLSGAFSILGGLVPFAGAAAATAGAIVSTTSSFLSNSAMNNPLEAQVRLLV